MSDSEELARKERRRKLIERLNEKEKLIGPHTQGRPAQLSEEELAAEIEKERQRNLSRQGFPYTGIGGG
jgi:transposase